MTRETLDAVAFPTFVADLINGTFNAIVNASIRQMEAFAALLSNVAKTVDQFMADNITDNQAKDWLVSKYPYHLRVDTSEGEPKVVMRDDAADREPPSLRQDLGLDMDVDLDDDTIAETLVPAARRNLAQHRHQLLSTMVLLGINRIVVTSGRIRASSTSTSTPRTPLRPTVQRSSKNRTPRSPAAPSSECSVEPASTRCRTSAPRASRRPTSSTPRST